MMNFWTLFMNMPHFSYPLAAINQNENIVHNGHLIEYTYTHTHNLSIYLYTLFLYERFYVLNITHIMHIRVQIMCIFLQKTFKISI